MPTLRALKYYHYFRRHPWFYLRFPWELLRRRLSRAPRILLGEFYFDSRCNLRCWHCSSSRYLDRKIGMTLAEIESVVKQLRAAGVVSICYVGGEPTLRPDLPEILRLTNRRWILPSLITNGTMLTEEKIDELFAAGLANLGFSLQSMRAETHDRLVNRPGSHENLMRLVAYAVRRRHTVSLCVVPTNENLADGDFAALVRYAAQNNLRANVNLPAPTGRLAADDAGLLTPASLERFFAEFLPRDNVMPDFKVIDPLRPSRCSMTEYGVYILPDGEVCPCTFVHISFGNILKEPLPEILARFGRSRALRNLRRENQCPIAMDPAFIASVRRTIAGAAKYPPDWTEWDQQARQDEGGSHG